VSSSMGRILDALSCYLNICCKRTYDGEPAMKLEKYLAMGEPKYSFDVDVKNNVIGTIDLFKQLDGMIKKSLTEKDKADYSYSFVNAIVNSLSDLGLKWCIVRAANSFPAPLSPTIAKVCPSFILNETRHTASM